MGLDQKGSSVFRVQQTNTGNWDVMEVGIEKPLASFDTQMDASKYVFVLASTKDESRVELFNEHGKQIAEVDVEIISEDAAEISDPAGREVNA